MTVESSPITRITQNFVDNVLSEAPRLTAEARISLAELPRAVRLAVAQSQVGDGMVRAGRGCARCESRWDGLNTAHCGACHETFTTPGVFDKHRRNGKCLPPPDAGLVLASRGYSCWTTPGRPGMLWRSSSEPHWLANRGSDPSAALKPRDEPSLNVSAHRGCIASREHEEVGRDGGRTEKVVTRSRRQDLPAGPNACRPDSGPDARSARQDPGGDRRR